MERTVLFRRRQNHEGRRLAKRLTSVVCRWVLEAWGELPPAIIQPDFLECCTSNALDGSQDNAIYNSESDDGDNDISESDYPHDDAQDEQAIN